MKKYKVYQVDAFTTERFRGKPGRGGGQCGRTDGEADTGHCPGAEQLRSAFIFPSQEEGVDCQVRFFTPKTGSAGMLPYLLIISAA